MMSITFGDFSDILELILNKDPLGLNSEIIESYQATNAKSEVPSETKMEEYNVIPHCLKSNVTNVNNNADTKDEDPTISRTSPILQANIPSTQTRVTHSIIKYIGQTKNRIIDTFQGHFFTSNMLTIPQWQDTFTTTKINWIQR